MKNLALFLLLLAACTQAGKPTAAPSPTAMPTPTVTPVPPLVAHKWTQSDPLIAFIKDRGGLMWCCFGQVGPIDFTLLPNGDLYLLSKTGEILTTKLSRQATCNLLNSIDQAGFFDYDPSSYVVPGGTDAGGTFISVHAWRANSVGLVNLTYYIHATPPAFPTDLRAIRNTFWLLDRYQPPGTLEALKPGRLGVWLMQPPIPAGTSDLMEWPLKSDRLAAASPGRYQRMLPTDPLTSPAMILTGAEATQVYDALPRSYGDYGWGTFVREGDKAYRVFVRPLSPVEFNSSPLPDVSLSCSPSDGWTHAP